MNNAKAEAKVKDLGKKGGLQKKSQKSASGAAVHNADRTKTGVPGLDEILNGGIPRGNLTVLSGDPGSGKTCLGLGYLFYGATKYYEKGVFVSLEETEEEIIKIAAEFGWDYSKLVREDKIRIITLELYDFEKLQNIIEDVVSEIGAKRIVIDPGVVFKLFFEKELDARKKILSLGRLLKRIGVTAIITNEINLDRTTSLFGLEEYVADGVLLLYHTKIRKRFERSIAVLKMRGTKTSESTHPVRITSSGIEVASREAIVEDSPTCEPL